MKKSIITILILALVFVQGTIAQHTITGTVTDEKGEALPGVNVRVKGYSDIGTISDVEGKYSLEVPDDATVLIFTFVGMENLEIEIAGQTVINATLKTSDVDISEVVVTALGINRE